MWDFIISSSLVLDIVKEFNYKDLKNILKPIAKKTIASDIQNILSKHKIFNQRDCDNLLKKNKTEFA